MHYKYSETAPENTSIKVTVGLCIKLNLRSLQCEELRIITHVQLPVSLAKRIAKKSHKQPARDVPIHSIYGMVYTINKLPYAIRADFGHISKKKYHVEFRYVAEKWPKPPIDIKPPQEFIDLLAEEPQDLMIECYADFVYNKGDGWKSEVSVPAPLTSSKEGEQLLTHVEAIRFSRREQGRLQYSIEVEPWLNDSVKHHIYLSEPYDKAITEDIPTLMLQKCDTISKSLVSKK